MRHTSAAPTSAAPTSTAATSAAPSAPTIGISVPGATFSAEISGSAEATGSNATETTANLTNKLRETPSGVTVAKGEATFTAEGTGTDASATAYAGVDVQGADYVFEITKNRPGGTSTDATDTSTTKYIAIDIPGYTPPGGEQVISKVINLPSMPAHSGGSGLPSGTNSSHSTISAEAVGADSVAVGVNASHLAVGPDGQLSSTLSAASLVAN